MSREIEVETTVGEDYSVTIPTSVREEASLSAGDPLRWRVDDAGTLSVERVEQYFGAFSELEPVDSSVEHDHSTRGRQSPRDTLSSSVRATIDATTHSPTFPRISLSMSFCRRLSSKSGTIPPFNILNI